MNVEIQSMKDNDVWDLLPLLEGIKHIYNKRYKTKWDSNDNVERFKAPLAVKSFTQMKALIRDGKIGRWMRYALSHTHLKFYALHLPSTHGE